jgi:hypothetical protein
MATKRSNFLCNHLSTHYRNPEFQRPSLSPQENDTLGKHCYFLIYGLFNNAVSCSGYQMANVELERCVYAHGLFQGTTPVMNAVVHICTRESQ